MEAIEDSEKFSCSIGAGEFWPGCRHRIFCKTWGILPSDVNFSSRWHMKPLAITGTRGEPILNWPLNWKKNLLVVAISVVQYLYISTFNFT